MHIAFMSYSSQDQEFADRLHTDLQRNGVRCWYAPYDMKTGDEIRSRIDESILSYEKLLVILSEYSLASFWVKDEVEAAYAKENRQRSLVLFPIRLDQEIEEAHQAWAVKLLQQRHITNFTGWKYHDLYQKACEKLLRDLNREDTMNS